MGDESLINALHDAMVNRRLTSCQQRVDPRGATIFHMGNSYTKETFASRLLALKRQGDGLTNEGLARIAAGTKRKAVSKQAVTKWLAGLSIPDPDSLKNLAEHFGVTREWLYFGAGSPRSPKAIEIAICVDLLPEEDQREVSRDLLRRLDGVRDIKMGGERDTYMAKLRVASEALKKYTKPQV